MTEGPRRSRAGPARSPAPAAPSSVQGPHGCGGVFSAADSRREDFLHGAQTECLAARLGDGRAVAMASALRRILRDSAETFRRSLPSHRP
jgi:hypothetical protein